MIFKGEIYPRNISIKELFHSIVKEGIHYIRHLKGEFFVVYYNDDLKKIYVANDKLGVERLFFYYKKNNDSTLILSDDFWRIINIIEPDEGDLDVQSIKEFAFFVRPLFYKTIIKNLEFFPPASIGEFSFEDYSFNTKKYWDFKYTPATDISIDDAVERVDHLLNDAMRQIREKNDLNTVYGIGLSGGLDSRVVVHYALKHNMKLKCFILGEKKPNKLLLSRDRASARKLAKHFNANLSEIEYDCERFEDKSFYEIRYAPTRGSRIFRTIHDCLPEFDVFLTGMNGGELFGSVIPHNIMDLNENELLECFIERLSNIKGSKGSNLAKVKTVLSILLGRDVKHLNRNERSCIKWILTPNEYRNIKSKILQFIKDNSDKSNISIFQKYLYFFHLNIHKYGFFGGLYGQKKSFRIFFNPDLLEEMLTWRPEFLIRRSLQNHLFIKKLSELSKIKAQDYEVAISNRNKRPKLLRRIFSRAEFMLRGNGLRDQHWMRKNKEYIDFSRTALLRKNPIFSHIFDVEKVLELRQHDGDIYDDIVKIKQILDFIQNKGYKSFFKNEKTNAIVKE